MDLRSPPFNPVKTINKDGSKTKSEKTVDESVIISVNLKKYQTFYISILVINMIDKYKLKQFFEKKIFENFQNG